MHWRDLSTETKSLLFEFIMYLQNKSDVIPIEFYEVEIYNTCKSQKEKDCVTNIIKLLIANKII